MASVTRWMAGLGLTAVILAAGALTPAKAAEFKVGSWVGRDVSKEGKFLGCEIFSSFPNKQGLAFGISARGVFEIRVTNGSWALEPGKIPVSMWVDDQPKLSGDALAAAKDSIIVPVREGGKQFADTIKKGNVLHVATAKGDVDFKLTGTSKAIGELESCWQKGMGQAGSAPAGNASAGNAPAAAARQPSGTAPAGPPPTAGKPVKGSALLGLEPREFALQIVTSADKGFYTLEAQNPNVLKQLGAALLWRMKDGFGFVTAVNSDPDVQALRDKLISQKQPKCKGQLTSTTDVRTLAGTAVTVKRVEIACSDVGEGRGIVEIFSFYPQLSGTLTAVLHASGNRQTAVDGDAQFAKRVTAVLKSK